jgi:type VI secretion system protein ImpF
MPKASYRDLVQPSLLDRLTDGGEGASEDGGRTYSLSRLRAVILRDVSWLLNATPLGSSVDLTAYPDVASGVLNYGVRPLAGQGGGATDRSHFERAIQEALTLFEPRLVSGVRVKLLPAGSSDTTLVFIIEADLWAEPVPLRLRLRTEVDRDRNTVRIAEQLTEAE